MTDAQIERELAKWEPLIGKLLREFPEWQAHHGDLAQEARLVLWQRLKAGERFGAGYATVTCRGVMKHFLRDKALTIRVPGWWQELGGTGPEMVGLPEGDAGDDYWRELGIEGGQEAVETHVDCERVLERVMDGMRPKQREVMEMVAEGMETGEIGKCLGICGDSVRIRKRNAMKHMREVAHALP